MSRICAHATHESRHVRYRRARSTPSHSTEAHTDQSVLGRRTSHHRHFSTGHSLPSGVSLHEEHMHQYGVRSVVFGVAERRHAISTTPRLLVAPTTHVLLFTADGRLGLAQQLVMVQLLTQLLECKDDEHRSVRATTTSSVYHCIITASELSIPRRR